METFKGGTGDAGRLLEAFPRPAEQDVVL